MPAFVVEPPDSRTYESDAAGVPMTGEIKFDVYGTTDEQEVETAVQAVLPAFYRGLFVQGYNVKPEEGGIWRGQADYARVQPRVLTESRYPSPGGGGGGGGSGVGEAPFFGQGGGQALGFESKLSISFDTTGGTRRLTQSLQSFVYSAAGAEVELGIANKNAINLTERGVEGIEIEDARFNWTETHRMAAVDITEQYVRDLRDLRDAGTNEAAFRGMAPGEVRFRALSGSHRQGDDAELSFGFEAGLNRFDVDIGDIHVTEIGAHEYVEVRYVEAVEEVGGHAIKVPELVLVHKIWPGGDFDKLLIGN